MKGESKKERREEKYNLMVGFLLFVSTGFWESGIGKKNLGFIQCQPSHYQRTVTMLVGYLNKPQNAHKICSAELIGNLVVPSRCLRKI